MSSPATLNSTCFDNLISLRGLCDDILPTSGFYINDIGISKNELDELVTEDFKDGNDLFLKKLNFSIKEVASKVHTALQPKYRAKSVIENMRVGFYQDDLIQIPAIDNNFRLLQFKFQNCDSFLNLGISEISLQLDYTGNVDISVFDLMTGKLIDTIPIQCVANEVSTIFPAKIYHSRRKNLNLIFAYDSTGKTANTTKLLRNGGCSGCKGKKHFTNQYLKIIPGKIGENDQKIDKNIVETTDTGGLSIVYSLSCNHTDWLCSIQNVIALPVLYKTGAAIMEHGINNTPNELMTPRTQSVHLLEARYNSFISSFNETFNDIIKTISLPNDEKCFACNNRISHRSMIPS